MPGLLPDTDSDGLLEYSVVYTDRAVNHMSASFQSVMNDISTGLRSVYNADAIAVVPGSGSFGMEAVVRQFAADQHTLIVRNGWFSFRWTQILDAACIARSSTVMKARPVREGARPPLPPPPSMKSCLRSGEVAGDHGCLRERGGHAYHASMLTDALRTFRDTMKETEVYGFEAVRDEQQELGDRVRALLAERGFTSMAAEGFCAPGVVVSYTDDPSMASCRDWNR